ncbi:MAG: helix-turn-helix domain-containing protein [Candidatus Omnitrophica bacterium]|nr:helix-turn-helix domain-containing protein [Candidatus Omnitrophota bacterium]
MKKKINARLKKIILSQHKSNPGLGVRKLASLLEKKHGLSVSKSTIHLIVKASKIELKKGPKKALTAYKKKSLDECGLILLRCIDNYLGLFDYLTDELNAYFSKLKKELLNKFLVLSSLAAISGQNFKQTVRKKNYQRLAGIYHFPVKKFSYFSSQIKRYKPTVEVSGLGNNLTIISGIKIIFKDGSYIFSDSKMATLWDSPPGIEYFFSPLKYSQGRLAKMVREGLFIIGYTKSFDRFSPLVFKLIEGFEKGVSKVQFLDTKSKVVSQIEVKKRAGFILGYYPKGVSKGIKFKERKKRYSRLHFSQLGTFYIFDILSELLKITDDESVTSNNVLIRNKDYGLPNWGLVISERKISKNKLRGIVKNYFYLWPNREKNFFEGTKMIEQSFLTGDKQKGEIAGIMPHKISFSQEKDFARVGQLLLAVFKEVIEGVEPKRKSGFLKTGKDHITVVLEGLPVSVAERLNRQAFFIRRKRVFFR